MTWVMLAVVIVLPAFSAVLALAETSLVRMSKAKAMSLEEEGLRGARQLSRLVERPERFLNGVLLLVLVCQLVTATLVGLLAERWLGGVGVAVATVFEVVVIFVLAEAMPKNYAVRNPERSALFSAPLVGAIVNFPPVRVISSALIGLADLLVGAHEGRATVSESELLALADVAHDEEVIEHDERALIHSIFEFGDTVVREVMVPRPEMRVVDASKTVSAALGEALDVGYSRLPAIAGNIDDVVGIAYLKDLVRAERAGRGGDDVAAHARPAHFVPESKRVSSLMRQMQAETFHQAIVVDEYGGTAGLVTLEDLIEELVGEIVDEFDVVEPPVRHISPTDVSVSARLRVEELNELLDSELHTGTWATVGGLMFDVLGHVPEVGEGVDVDGVRLVAERVEGNRIGRVRASAARSE